MSRLRLWRHVLALAWRADPVVVGVIAALVVGQSLALAAIGLSQRWVVDAASDHRVATLAGAALAGALAHTVFAAGNRAKVNYEDDLADRVDLELNREILGITASVPTLEHLERTDYLDRVSLLRKHTRALAGSCWAFVETVSSVLAVLLSVWLLMDVHPVLGVLALLALPPLWAAKRARRYVAEANAATAADQRHEERLHQMCIDPATAREIYVGGSIAVLDRVADEARRRVVAAVLRARVGAIGWQLAGWLCYAAGYIGALVLVARMVQQGSASLGELMLVVTIGTRLRIQVHVTVDSFSDLADAGHAADHYRWLREFADGRRPAGAVPAPDRLVEGIRLRGVGFAYPGGPPVLDGVDLTLRAGSTVALVGVNGAGKTTLVKLLTGMYAPTAGVIEVDGVPLGELDLADWRRQVSGAFQDFTKFELPTGRAVGVGHLPALDDRPEVTRAVVAAGADGVVGQLPEGLDTQLGRVYGGAELSHGQWQRLALARGLMRRRPLLLVLDEPTAALDPQAEHELYELFLEQATAERGRITLLVSHRFSTLRNADHVVVLADGRVAEQGTHDSLMASGGQYAQLYATQAAAYR